MAWRLGQAGPQDLRLDTPEHRGTADAKAWAYVRPHDFDVQRYAPGATGIVARLSRAIVVGPTARLELIPEDDNPSAQHAVIEAQLPASQYRELGLTEGELLVLTPRKARVFTEGTSDLAQAT